MQEGKLLSLHCVVSANSTGKLCLASSWVVKKVFYFNGVDVGRKARPVFCRSKSVCFE